jgi:hypothetical protein
MQTMTPHGVHHLEKSAVQVRWDLTSGAKDVTQPPGFQSRQRTRGIAIVACRERSQNFNGSPVNQAVLMTPLRLGGGFRGLIDSKPVSFILESRLPAVGRYVGADGRMHSRPIDDVIDP